MTDKIQDQTLYNRANAVAGRLADEMQVNGDDRPLLADVLLQCFLVAPAQMERLYGTSMIEEDFDTAITHDLKDAGADWNSQFWAEVAGLQPATPEVAISAMMLTNKFHLKSSGTDLTLFHPKNCNEWWWVLGNLVMIVAYCTANYPPLEIHCLSLAEARKQLHKLLSEEWEMSYISELGLKQIHPPKRF